MLGCQPEGYIEGPVRNASRAGYLFLGERFCNSCTFHKASLVSIFLLSCHSWDRMRSFLSFNSRPAGGGGQNLPPFRIFAITPKPLQISPRNLEHLTIHQFDIDCASFIEIHSDFCWKMAFLWRHYKPFSVKIVKMFRNSPKLHFWRKPREKQQICKMTRVTKCLSWFYKNFSFWPNNLKKKHNLKKL